MANGCRVLLISGSLRQRSTNTGALRTAQAVAPPAIATVLYGGIADLPHFNPDHDVDPLPPAVLALRSEIWKADAVLLSTPEYAGGLPGSFKNLLDWTVGDDHLGSIYEKPVGWINASARGAVDAYDSLRKVLGYAHATLVEEACVHIPVTAAMLDDDDLITDPAVRDRIASALVELANHVDRRRLRQC
jgi:chromate reductase